MRYFWFGIWVGENGRPNFTCYCYNNHMNNLSLLCKTKDNFEVYYDPISSHAATHFNDAPNLKELVIELLEGLETGGKEIARHFDMGKPIGTMDVVRVDDTDELVYATRMNRESDGLVPFVKSRKGNPCPYVAVHLVPQLNGVYILESAWIGTFGGDDEPFPMAKDATPRSVEFWSKHAFVWGSQGIEPESVTTTRPW